MPVETTKLANFSLRTWVIVILVLLVVILIIASVAMHEATRAHNRLNDLDNEIADALTGVGEQLLGGELILFQDGSARVVPHDDDPSNELTGGAKKRTLGQEVENLENCTYYGNGFEIEKDQMFTDFEKLYNVTCVVQGQLLTSNLLPGIQKSTDDSEEGQDSEQVSDGEGDVDNNGEGDGQVGGGEIPGQFIEFQNLRLGGIEDSNIYLREGEGSIIFDFRALPDDYSDEEQLQLLVAVVTDVNNDMTRYTVGSNEVTTTEDNKIRCEIPIVPGNQLLVRTNITQDEFHKCEVSSAANIDVKLVDGNVEIKISGVTSSYSVTLNGASFNDIKTSSIQEGHQRTISFRQADFLSATNSNGELIHKGTSDNIDPYSLNIDIDNTVGEDYHKNESVDVLKMAIPFSLKRSCVVGDIHNRVRLLDDLSDQFQEWIGSPDPDFRIQIVNSSDDDVTNQFDTNMYNTQTGELRLVQDPNVTQPANYNGYKARLDIVNPTRQSCFRADFPINEEPLTSLRDLAVNRIVGLSLPHDTAWRQSSIDGWSVKDSLQKKVGNDGSWEPCSDDDNTFEEGTYYRSITEYKHEDAQGEIVAIASDAEMLPSVVPSVLDYNSTVTGQDGVLRHSEFETEQYFFVDKFDAWTDVQVTGGPNNAVDLLVYTDAANPQSDDGKFKLALANVGYSVTVQLKTSNNQILTNTWDTQLKIEVNKDTTVEGVVYVGERISISPSDGVSNAMFRIHKESIDNAVLTPDSVSEWHVDSSMDGKSFSLEYVNESNPEYKGTSDSYSVSHSCDIDFPLGNLAKLHTFIPQLAAADFTPQLRTASLDANGNKQWTDWDNDISEIALTPSMVSVQGQMVDLTTVLPSAVFDVPQQ